jgi:hypothetical protein
MAVYGSRLFELVLAWVIHGGTVAMAQEQEVVGSNLLHLPDTSCEFKSPPFTKFVSLYCEFKSPTFANSFLLVQSYPFPHHLSFLTGANHHLFPPVSFSHWFKSSPFSTCLFFSLVQIITFFHLSLFLTGSNLCLLPSVPRLLSGSNLHILPTVYQVQICIATFANAVCLLFLTGFLTGSNQSLLPIVSLSHWFTKLHFCHATMQQFLAGSNFQILPTVSIICSNHISRECFFIL